MRRCLHAGRVLSYDQPGLLIGEPGPGAVWAKGARAVDGARPAPAADGAKAALSVRPIAAGADFPFGEGVAADQHPPARGRRVGASLRA